MFSLFAGRGRDILSSRGWGGHSREGGGDGRNSKMKAEGGKIKKKEKVQEAKRKRRNKSDVKIGKSNGGGD